MPAVLDPEFKKLFPYVVTLDIFPLWKPARSDIVTYNHLYESYQVGKTIYRSTQKIKIIETKFLKFFKNNQITEYVFEIYRRPIVIHLKAIRFKIKEDSLKFIMWY